MAGDPRFHALLRQIGELHDRKQEDYGLESDPFANVRSSEDIGIPGWVGALIRAGDKFRRLQKAARGGTMANESVEDSFMDGVVYLLIGLILYREYVTEQVEDEQAFPELPGVEALRDYLFEGGQDADLIEAQADVWELMEELGYLPTCSPQKQEVNAT
jgi:hypothetical protein